MIARIVGYSMENNLSSNMGRPVCILAGYLCDKFHYFCDCHFILHFITLKSARLTKKATLS